MEIRFGSVLLGLGLAWLMPLLTRSLRPLAVEAAAAGMGLVEDARRMLAEQIEMVEDIAAEARARREEMAAAAETNGAAHAGAVVAEDQEEDTAEPAAVTRSRRRGNGSARRRAS